MLAGWVTTEVGRQPFTIYGVLRTVDSASPLDAPAVAVSLLAFVVVYFAVFGMGVWYLLRLMKKPPEAHEAPPSDAPIRSAGITPAPQALASSETPGRFADRVLLSSEPYRFTEKHFAETEVRFGAPAQLIDGEMVSWYGSRAVAGLRYLARQRLP